MKMFPARCGIGLAEHLDVAERLVERANKKLSKSYCYCLRNRQATLETSTSELNGGVMSEIEIERNPDEERLSELSVYG